MGIIKLKNKPKKRTYFRPNLSDNRPAIPWNKPERRFLMDIRNPSVVAVTPTIRAYTPKN